MDGLVGVVGWMVLAPNVFVSAPWHFENGASSKIDNVLAEDGGLLHVLPFAIHLIFFMLKSYGWRVAYRILVSAPGILKMVYQVRFMIFLLKMVDYSMSLLSLST